MIDLQLLKDAAVIIVWVFFLFILLTVISGVIQTLIDLKKGDDQE